MIAVTYHSDLKEMQSDQRFVAALDDQFRDAPFDRIGWWLGLVTHCGIDPMLAVAQNDSGTLILPLAKKPGQLEALANWYNFRFQPVATPNADRNALLLATARDLAKTASRIILSGIPEENEQLSALVTAFRKTGWIVLVEPCDRNHILNVQNRSYDEYLASRPGPLRTTLKRKAKKVACEVLTHFDEAAWADYEEIYRDSWKPEEGSPEFILEFAKAEGAAGRLRLGIAKLDGEAVAAQLWTVEGDTAFIHKLAYKEKAKPLSPGTALSAALFRHVIDLDKVHMVDFGTGDDGYKRDWMEEVRLRYRLDMMRPGNPKNWPILAKSGLSRLAARAKQR